MSITKSSTNSLDSEDPSADILAMLDMGSEGIPSSEFLFGEVKEKQSSEIVDKGSFQTITKFFEDSPNNIFMDKNYYQKALNGENEESKRFHKIFTSFLNTTDNKERSDLRPRLITTYRDLAESISKRSGSELSDPKRYTLRFGTVLPNLLSSEQRNILSKIIVENNTGEPVYYIDEWLAEIANGNITSSASDEVKHSQQKKTNNLKPQIEKHEGQKNAFIHLIKEKQRHISDTEENLSRNAVFLKTKLSHSEFNDIFLPYDKGQKQYLNMIAQNLKDLQKANKELESLFSDLEKTIDMIKQLKEKAEFNDNKHHVDVSVLVKEFATLQQMAKMSVGRKGNHLQILMKQYFPPHVNNIGTRENVINTVAMVEKLDPGIFKRTFRRETSRIVPNFILLPCYGERGICWEPFEKYNRGTSRGRLAIPMFPKDLKIAVISALADLRWQVSKEKGQHYWMEEGLTGRYYQWFSENKLKGDVRERFILDYILWITKESVGTQKLDREVRGIFWRELSFPEKVRKDLKNRGFVYNELFKKDLNRLRSDGY